MNWKVIRDERSQEQRKMRNLCSVVEFLKDFTPEIADACFKMLQVWCELPAILVYCLLYKGDADKHSTSFMLNTESVLFCDACNSGTTNSYPYVLDMEADFKKWK